MREVFFLCVMAGSGISAQQPGFREIVRIPVEVDPAAEATISPDGSLVATLSTEGSVRVRSVEPWRVVGELAVGDGRRDLAFLAGGEDLVVRGPAGMEVFEIDGGGRVQDTSGYDQAIERARWSRLSNEEIDAIEESGFPWKGWAHFRCDDARQRMVVVTKSGRAFYWDGRDERCLNDPGGASFAMSFSADGRFLCALRSTHVIRVDVESGTHSVHPFGDEAREFGVVCRGATGPEVVFIDRRGVVVWNAALAREVRRVPVWAEGSGSRWVKCIKATLSPDARRVLFWTESGVTTVDLVSGRVANLAEAMLVPNDLAWTPDGFAVRTDGWSSCMGSSPNRIDLLGPEGQHRSWTPQVCPESIAFVPGSRRALVGSIREVVLIDSDTGDEIHRVRACGREIACVSPELALVFGFREVSLRSVRDLQTVAALELGGTCYSAAVAPRGRTFALSLKKGEIAVYRYDLLDR